MSSTPRSLVGASIRWATSTASPQNTCKHVPQKGPIAIEKGRPLAAEEQPCSLYQKLPSAALRSRAAALWLSALSARVKLLRFVPGLRCRARVMTRLQRAKSVLQEDGFQLRWRVQE